MKLFFQYTFPILIVLLSSCTSNKPLLEKEEVNERLTTIEKREAPRNKIETFQIPNGNQTISNESPLIIQANDILAINLSSRDKEALAPFKITYTTEERGTSDKYLVNRAGEIEFPTIGAVKVKGLQIEEAKEQLINLLNPYFIKPPIVKMQLTNFKVNVNGEVKAPNSFVISNARLTIIEAITMAGDFTRYANRDSVLVIREQNGVREFGSVNFNSSDIFISKYFYLRQNDVIHVPVDSQKLNNSKDKN